TFFSHVDPITGVSILRIDPDATATKLIKNWGSVVLACAVTWYFFHQNLRGIHESSDKALKIMVITTIMGVIMIGWCLLTLGVKGSTNPIPTPAPHLQPRMNYTVDPPQEVDPTGFIKHTSLAAKLRGEKQLDPNGEPIKNSAGNVEY